MEGGLKSNAIHKQSEDEAGCDHWRSSHDAWLAG